MKRALFFTVYDRPHYFAPTLSSWSNVRGLERWHVVFRIEPSEAQDVMVRLIEQFVEVMRLTDYKIVVNERRLGVLHHPWVGFEELFSEYDFVVRAEDDLVVSTDILEYLEWASIRYRMESNVGAVHSYSMDRREDTEDQDSDVVLRPWFNPLIWGTWKDRWVEVIRDTWDHDYSTFNGHPGLESGWDWNLNTRIFPEYGLLCAHPCQSRTDHIGVHGTHGNEENFRSAETFRMSRPETVYQALSR